MSAALAIGQRAFLSALMIWDAPFMVRFRGVLQALLATLLVVALVSWNPADPSLNAASSAAPTNWLGVNGALFADIFMQSLGLAAWPAAALTVAFGLAAAIGDAIQQRLKPTPLKALAASGGVLSLSAALSALAAPDRLAAGGRSRRPVGRRASSAWSMRPSAPCTSPAARSSAASSSSPSACGPAVTPWACGSTTSPRASPGPRACAVRPSPPRKPPRRRPVRPAPEAEAAPARAPRRPARLEMPLDDEAESDAPLPWDEPVPALPPAYPPPRAPARTRSRSPRPSPPRSKKTVDDDQAAFDFVRPEGDFALPPLGMLAKPQARAGMVDEDALKQNAKMLEGVLAEFGVKGVIDQIRPGPVVTLYELVPAARREARPRRGPVRRHRPLDVAPAPAASASCRAATPSASNCPT